MAHFNTFDEDRIPADIPVRFAGERSEAPAFVELDVLDDIDAIGIGFGRHGLSKELKKISGKISKLWWTVRAVSDGKLLICIGLPVESVQAAFYR
jgi:hypothetical protein